MSPEHSPELGDELLNEFFSECDEHLSNIRQALVALESFVGLGKADRPTLDELLRNFHSFKGICAIVNLRPAEELAHALEDYLRELAGTALPFTSRGLALLMLGTQRLEQIAVAFRNKLPVPAIDSLLADIRAELDRGMDTHQPQPASAASTAAQEPAPEQGVPLWKFIFTPSRELDAAGINVTSIRTRLGGVGEILRAAPIIRGEGQLSFEFLVAVRNPPADMAAWEKDGLRGEPAPQPSGTEENGPPNQHVPAEWHSPFIAPSHVVRVDLPRLDELMRLVGEMVIHRSRFEDELNRLSRKGAALDIGALREVNTRFARSLRELREGIMRVRMVPVAEIFARMPFVVRDLAAESGKKARLRMEGQQTEIDKYLIEKLKDPLLHLVRNSFSHGVEPPEERLRSGKSEEATITLGAAATGDSVIISVRDDGRGISRPAVLKRAAELDIPVPTEVDNPALLHILCTPGFSTRAKADLAAGRGVGLEVVQKTVRELSGTLALETEEQRGTAFIIRVPLTLAIAETMIVSAADQICAVPQNFVSEVLPLNHSDIRTANGVEVIPHRDGVLPVIRLAKFFRLDQEPGERLSVLVLNSDRGSCGLVVDRIHGQREVVIRPMRDPLIRAPGIAGATELGDGRPVLILDGAAFTNGAVRPNHAETRSPATPAYAG